MNTKAYLALCGVFIGCCANVVFLELLIRLTLLFQNYFNIPATSCAYYF